MGFARVAGRVAVEAERPVRRGRLGRWRADYFLPRAAKKAWRRAAVSP